MKKLFAVVIFLLFSLSLAVLASGQSSKETYRALKKLEAKTQTGISYQDYGPALGEAKLEINLFSESPEAKEKPKLKEIFYKTMGHYEEAGNVWGCQFAGRGPAYNMVPAQHGGTDSDLIAQVLRTYPKARFKVDAMGCLPYSEVIKIMWQEATNELKKAGPLLK